MPETVLSLDARNPGEFLAGCGIVELASQTSPGLRSRWSPDGDQLCLGELQDEAAVLDTVLALAQAAASLPEGPEPPGPLCLSTHGLRWWVGGVEIDKGEWAWASGPDEGKFWAGNQRLLTILRELGAAACARPLLRLSDVRTPTPDRGLRSSLRYDVLAQPTPNQLGRPANLAVKPPVRPWLELLAAIGRRWFPPQQRARIAQGCATSGLLRLDGGNEGWFMYAAWLEPLSPVLARVACLPGAPARVLSLKSRIVKTGKYRSFTAAVKNWGNAHA